DANELLDQVIAEKSLTAAAAFGLWPANRVGHNDVQVRGGENEPETMFHFLRQQAARSAGEPQRCLADFIAPQSSGETDYLGGFAVAVHGAEALACHFEAEGNDYQAIMGKAIADRLAEAFAERLHERVRREFWGYAPQENLGRDELIREQYRGIRPAPGYPACPDHSEKTTLLRLLEAESRIGMKLTESYATLPAASITGWYFAHPEARYFPVGKIGADQVDDLARRKQTDPEPLRRLLAPNLD
ncbi:MAG: methionine synthase, partial [Gammaproteobacteria bacterium]|nr:methionine synthase [Gammaproteobacteria bacterium]